MRLNRLRQFNISGTTSALVNQPMLNKKQDFWKTSYLYPFGFCGEGLYFSSLMRRGANFEISEAVFEAGATTDLTGIKLTSKLIIYAYKDVGDSNKGKVIAFSISGNGTLTAGVIKEFEAGATTSIDLTKITDSRFAISFRDGSDSYCKVVACSVSDLTITSGTAVNVVSAVVNDTGTCITNSIDDVVVVGYVLNSDGKGYVRSSVVTLNVPATFSSPEEFEAGTTTKLPNITTHSTGEFTLVYQDGAAANDPITYRIGFVTADGVLTLDGSSASLAGNASAATLIDLKSLENGNVIASWVDNGIGHVRAGSVDDTTITWGAELEVITAANTPIYLRLALLGSDEGILAYENDDLSDYGFVTTFSIAGVTLGIKQTDIFAEAACAHVSIIAYDGDRFCVAFRDEGNSNKGTAIVGIIKDNLIDIRSTVVSAKFDGFMLHRNRSGLGYFAANRITGTTNSSANTAMGTKPTLPYNKWNDVLLLFKDQGMYLEDDGTVAPQKSGISKSNRNIDIRSQTTSVEFDAFVLKAMGQIRTVSL